MKPKVFIIYQKSRTREIALDLFHALKDAGADPWMDEESLALGVPWKQAIERELPLSCAAVVILQPDFEGPGYRQDEVRRALDTMRSRPVGGGFVIPFLAEPCDIPSWCLDLHAGRPTHRASTLPELINAINYHCKAQLNLPAESILAKPYTHFEYGLLIHDLIEHATSPQTVLVSIGRGDFVETMLLRLFDEREAAGLPPPKIGKLHVLHLSDALANSLMEQGVLEPDFLRRMHACLGSIKAKVDRRGIPFVVTESTRLPQYHGWCVGDRVFTGEWKLGTEGFLHVNTHLHYLNPLRHQADVQAFKQLFA